MSAVFRPRREEGGVDGLAISWLTPDALPAVVELEQTVSGGWSEAQLSAQLSRPDAWHFVACLDNEQACLSPLAFILGSMLPPEAEVFRLQVCPAWQRRGLATDLLTHSLAFLKKGGVTDCFLELRAGNHPARALYEKMCFRQCGLRKSYYRNPTDDALLMLRKL